MPSTETIRCWRCDRDLSPAAFCPSCKAIQLLPAQTDYFTVMGLSKNPVIDDAELSKRYYDLSRRFHPDLYQAGTAQEQEASLKNTAMLNRAYRTLREPAQRGLYWLELHGEKIGAENNAVPPKLASLVFSVQEQLEELREARDAGKGEDVQNAVQHLGTDLSQQMTKLQHALESNFAEWGDGQQASAAQPELLASLKNILSEMAYLRRLLQDVEKEHDALWNA